MWQLGYRVISPALQRTGARPFSTDLLLAGSPAMRELRSKWESLLNAEVEVFGRCILLFRRTPGML
jgi:hypothetical protein